MPESEVTAEAVGLRTHPLTSIVQGALWAAAAAVGLVIGIGPHPVTRARAHVGGV